MRQAYRELDFILFLCKRNLLGLFVVVVVETNSHSIPHTDYKLGNTPASTSSDGIADMNY